MAKEQTCRDFYDFLKQKIKTLREPVLLTYIETLHNQAALTLRALGKLGHFYPTLHNNKYLYDNSKLTEEDNSGVYTCVGYKTKYV